MKRGSYILFLLVIIFFSHSLAAQDTQKAGCSSGTAQTILNYNNVKANFSTQGIFWQNATSLDAGYEIPSGSGLSTIFSGALWIGGYDQYGGLRVAADQWAGSGSDYWPGPLDDATGESSFTSCSNFDRFWGVSKSEIDLFLANATISNNILLWPGKNNPNLSYLPLNQELAPFVDINNDGNYNPSDGDYPQIKGETAIWWVLNDKGNSHTASSAMSLGVELHIMAYAFATNDDINDMTFYDLEIINKSTFTYFDTYVGIFMDPDIGGYMDDYVGCDTTWSLGYAYNGDNFDEDNGSLGYGNNPPLQAVTMLKKPTVSGVEYPMTSFMSFMTGGASTMNNPTSSTDFYNYMNSIWKDGSHLVYGGNGHSSTGGTIHSSFQYPGNPSISSEWSECSEASTPSDRKFVMSFGNLDFTPSAKMSMSFALVYHRPTSGSNCEGVNGLINSVQHAHTFYNTMPISIEETMTNNGLSMTCFPNPATDILHIPLRENIQGNIILELFDMQGRLISQEKRQKQDVLILNVSEIHNGYYLLKIISANGIMDVHKVAIQK